MHTFVSLRLSARLVVAVLMVACAVPVAYALDPTRSLTQFVRDEWGFERGYVGGVVRAIAETPDGYLWLGTDRGLVRFDGATFTLVAESDVSASGAAVLGLVVDHRGSLWIRRRGSNVQRLAHGRFEDMLWSLSPREEFVMTVAPGRGGSVLYAGRLHGIARHAQERFEKMAAWSAEDPVRSVAEAPDGGLWLGTDGSGVFVLRAGRLSAGPAALARESVEALSADASGVWIATRRGLHQWNDRGRRMEPVPAAIRTLTVTCMLRDRDANLWLGTTRGLVRLGPDGSVTFDLDGARRRPVTALLEDREGSLWIGSATGIRRLREGAFTPFARSEGLPADHTGPVHVDAAGRTWFGPVAGGLYWLQHGRVERVAVEGLERDVVLALAGHGDDVWVGRKRGGVTRLRVVEGALVARTFTVRDGLASNSISALHLARDGTVWAGTDGAGISSRLRGRGTLRHRDHGRRLHLRHRAHDR